MWCTTECWDCEDRKCEHYISKTELYFENQRLKDQLQQEENIRKEVREYITKQVHRNQQFYDMDIENILEILDKEVN